MEAESKKKRKLAEEQLEETVQGEKEQEQSMVLVGATEEQEVAKSEHMYSSKTNAILEALRRIQALSTSEMESALLTPLDHVNTAAKTNAGGEEEHCIQVDGDNSSGAPTIGTDKVVIFSNFVSYLDILFQAMQREGYDSSTVAQLNGRQNLEKRRNEINRFQNEPAVRIILCSVKAAGVGISLTAANHVFLSDLWWAPAVDQQAVDRVHRLGQKKPVQVLRFLCEDSIDERIFNLQKKKNRRSPLDKL